MTTENDVTHADEASTAELVGRITENLSSLFRKEIELAKAETKAEAVKAGMGAGCWRRPAC